MFGYVRASKPELKIKEYELYKAVYCSLCKKLGKSYGVLSRFTLSYDFTFLALINMALADKGSCIKKGRCAFNPLKRCSYCEDLSGLDMPSAAAMIMLYYKLKDNIADERGFKRLVSFLILPLFKGGFKKAGKKYPNIERIVSSYIAEQNALEKADNRSLDAAADPTAKALSSILMLCSGDEAQKRVLNRLGYCIGRYIYILDAACDVEKDIKDNSYNVLKEGYIKGNREYIKERTVPQLYFCVNEAAKALELLDIKRYKTVLSNIVYLGLEDTFKKELNL